MLTLLGCTYFIGDLEGRHHENMDTELCVELVEVPDNSQEASRLERHCPKLRKETDHG